jgi:ankyrin repeat protein
MYAQGNVSLDETKRQVELTIILEASSPKMPEGVIARTPSSSDMSILSTGKLPWFRYKYTWESQGDLKTCLRIVRPQWIPSTSITLQTNVGKNNAVNEMTLGCIPDFQSVIEALTCSVRNEILTGEFSKINSYLLAVMPETHSAEYGELFQKLLGPYNQDTIMQLFHLTAYLASNKLTFPTADITQGIIEWLLLQENSDLLQLLLSLKQPTTEALAESIFGAAVKIENLKLVKTILDTGLNPNSSRANDMFTPLQRASRCGNVELSRMLLDAGADVNLTRFSSNRPLDWAVSGGHIELVEILLDAGARVDMRDRNGDTVLHRAADYEHVELIQTLLDSGADVDSVNDDGETALHLAVFSENIEIVHYLLSAGADVNACDADGETVLLKAVKTYSPELVSRILDAGPQNTGTALCTAVSQRQTKTVQVLLDAGAYIDSPSLKYGITALTMAIICKDVELATYLLRKGADVNGWDRHFRSQPMTPLQAASARNMAKLAQNLLDAGADVNAPASDEYAVELEYDDECSDSTDDFTPLYHGTALQGAVRQRNHKLTEIFLEAGADVNAKAAKFNGRTALQAAVENGDNHLIEYLLAAGADINGQPGEVGGKTAFTAAVERADNKMIRLLLSFEADVNHPSAVWSGGTALEAAVKRADIDLVRYLLSIGADVDDPAALLEAVIGSKIELVRILLAARREVDIPCRKWYGCAALQVAISQEKPELVNILLEAEIDVNISPLWNARLEGRFWVEITNGRTALCMAIKKKNISLIRILLEAGADPNIQGPDSMTPLLQAVYEQDNSQVQILLEAGAKVDTSGGSPARRTPLQLAAQNGSIDIVEVLLKADANVNSLPSEEYGVTALQGAAIGGYIGIARILLNANADVNAPAARLCGRTALEGAAEHGRIDMLQCLLDAGAEVEGAGRAQYDNALYLAAREGHFAARKFLQSYHDSRFGTSNSTGEYIPSWKGDSMSTWTPARFDDYPLSATECISHYRL